MAPQHHSDPSLSTTQLCLPPLSTVWLFTYVAMSVISRAYPAVHVQFSCPVEPTGEFEFAGHFSGFPL